MPSNHSFPHRLLRRARLRGGDVFSAALLPIHSRFAATCDAHFNEPTQHPASTSQGSTELSAKLPKQGLIRTRSGWVEARGFWRSLDKPVSPGGLGRNRIVSGPISSRFRGARIGGRNGIRNGRG